MPSSSNHQPPSRPRRDYRNVASKISNFSVQYNIAAASAVVNFLSSKTNSDAYSQEPTWAKDTLLAALFAGAILGMFVMGYLGDALGRHPAMLITLSLVAVGGLGCTAIFGTSAEFLYAWYTVFRFIEGIGIGGIYPLAAAAAAESASASASSSSSSSIPSPTTTDDENEKKVNNEDSSLLASVDVDETEEEKEEQLRIATTSRIGWSFFFQQPGACAPYLLAVLFLSIFGSSKDLIVQTRIIFALGIVPAIVPIVLNVLSHRSSSSSSSPASAPHPQAETDIINSDDDEVNKDSCDEKQQQEELKSIAWARQQEEWPQLVRACFGCGLSWFLYDVSYYGTAVFTPVILGKIFPKGDLFDNTWHSAVTVLFSIPGTAIGVYTCKRRGCWWTGLTGFVAMAIGFLILGILMALGDHVNDYVKFVFFIILSILTAAGPSVSTYVTPALIFPTKVRTTFHGISAASAKFGALAGTLMYPSISNVTSVAFVLFLQVGFSLLGAASVFFLLPRKDEIIKGKGGRGGGRNGDYSHVPGEDPELEKK